MGAAQLTFVCASSCAQAQLSETLFLASFYPRNLFWKAGVKAQREKILLKVNRKRQTLRVNPDLLKREGPGIGVYRAPTIFQGLCTYPVIFCCKC